MQRCVLHCAIEHIKRLVRLAYLLCNGGLFGFGQTSIGERGLYLSAYITVLCISGQHCGDDALCIR